MVTGYKAKRFFIERDAWFQSIDIISMKIDLDVF